MPARIAFMGSPPFAVPALHAVRQAHDVRLVVTQPPRPAGRGRKPEATAVARAADALGLPCVEYVPRRRAEIEARLQRENLDALVVVAFGHILKPTTLAAARRGAVNVHASLLPRWRGVAPIERALAAGDAVTGATLMQLDEGVDTGPMIAQTIVPIDPEDDRLSLRARLAEAGAALLRAHLGNWVDGARVAVPQPSTGVTYAAKVAKEEGELDWSRDPLSLWYQVRAFAGWPGCMARLRGEILKVLAVQPRDLMPGAEPGTVVEADARRGVLVACGGGTLELLQVQRPGRAAVAARALVSGRQIRAGMRFETRPACPAEKP